MLKIPEEQFANAVEPLTIAAVSATDALGLKIRARLPELSIAAVAADKTPLDSTSAAASLGILPDPRDYRRIRAITLGAIIALLGEAAHPDSETHLAGFEKPPSPEFLGGLAEVRKGASY